MSDEREPLWSDDRIEAELRRIGDNMRLYIADAATVAEQVRDDYEARIAELKAEVRHWQQQHAECTTSLITEVRRVERLKKQLAQTWQPLPDGLIEKNEGKVSALLSGNGSVFSVTDGYVMNTVRFKTDTYRLCRLVESQPLDMPQPDWTTAPEWANWWSIDSNGKAYWWEFEPAEGWTEWIIQDGDSEVDRVIYPAWETTLRQRPTEVDYE